MSEPLCPFLFRYRADQNYGLVGQTVASLRRRKIQALTNTYMTLSLGDIAKNGGLADAAEAEAVLLNMIEDGENRKRTEREQRERTEGENRGRE